MVLRFFDKERGGIDYLQSNTTSVVLDGSLPLTKLVIEVMPWGHGQRFLSGVLNETADLPNDVAMQARREFEKQLRAGLPINSLHTLWVGQSDKIGHEQHFVIPQIELITGKRFSPYLDPIDRHRFAAWMESFNLRHNLPSAIDQLREQPDFTHSRAAKSDQEFLMKIWEIVRAGVATGIVTNRQEVLAILRDRGHQVRGETHVGKPLQQPVIVSPEGKNLRLNGSIYYRNDFGEELTRKLEARRNQPKEERLKALQKIIDDGVEFRAHYLVRRLFGTRKQRDIKPGKARKRLMSLMVEANRKLQALHPLLSVFSLQNAIAMLKLRRVVATAKEHLPHGETLREKTPNDRVGSIIELSSEFLRAMQSEAIKRLEIRQAESTESPAPEKLNEEKSSTTEPPNTAPAKTRPRRQLPPPSDPEPEIT